MSKIITFSQKFQKGHPSYPKRTLFVEKILNQRGINYKSPDYLNLLIGLNSEKLNDKRLSVWDLVDFQNSLVATDEIKGHTIRGSARFKVGEMFTPAVWKGKPYTECQIIFAPDIEIVKTWKVVIHDNNFQVTIPIKGKPNEFYMLSNGVVANNDGLELRDFKGWFDKLPFNGQIICFNPEIDYLNPES